MLNKDSILDSNNVRRDPVDGEAQVRKSSMHNHEASLSHDGSRFVLQRWRDALDEIEQTVAARCDMSAVLNVVRRPVALGRYVVPFIEESVKSLKNECLVLFLFTLAHCFFLSRKTVPCSLRVLRSSRSILPHVGECSANSSTRSG